MSTLARSVPAPAGTRSRWQRIASPSLLAGAVLVASVLLHLRDPHRSGSWGYCPWLVLTGTACPGCGGLRAVNDLTHGNVTGAASSNLLFVGAIPLVVYFWGRTFVDRWRGVTRVVDSRKAVIWSMAGLVLVAAFWVIRNLPFGSWLAP